MANKKFPVSSKFLSLILRHRPERIGLRLDKSGWADVEELLENMHSHGKVLDRTSLDEIVATNEKKRFSFNEDKTQIRANQGHSLKVDLGLNPEMPPDVLYHGTAQGNVPSILEIGLQKQNRHHVHLSTDEETARMVGKRHGKSVIFEVLAREMFNAGNEFFLSENGVWLTREVPVKFLKYKN